MTVRDDGKAQVRHRVLSGWMLPLSALEARPCGRCREPVTAGERYVMVWDLLEKVPRARFSLFHARCSPHPDTVPELL